jgi:hypothetical protein
MKSFGGEILIAIAVGALLLSSCGTRNSGESGFAVSLVETGEPILTDKDIATYVWKEHRIVLTPEGVDRWDSFAVIDSTQDPPVRKMGKLTGKEFVVTVDGVDMYRGHFSSMALSYMQPGVLLYDTIGAWHDELRLRFEQKDGEPKNDPRDRPEIAAHFRKVGKLK